MDTEKTAANQSSKKAVRSSFWRQAGTWLWVLPPAAALLIRSFFETRPDLAEAWQARGLFRAVSTPIGWLGSRLPFSLSEVILVLGVLAVPVLLIRWIYRLVRCSGSRLLRIGRTIRGLLWSAGLFLLLYMVLHGWNYMRLPLAQSFGLPTRPRLSTELAETAEWLASKTSEARARVNTDDQGVFRLRDGASKMLAEAPLGYSSAAKSFPQLNGFTPRPKGVMLSPYWSYTQVIGMYVPVLVEANVNTDAPPYEMPDAALHEMAHAKGFAREDEAGFLAFLSGISHPSADFAYSSLLHATQQTLGYLYEADRDAYGRAAGLLSADVHRDLAAGAAYWDRFKGPVAEFSTQVNQTFLEANKQQEGVRSYGRMVDLVLAWYEHTLAAGGLNAAVAALQP